MNTSKKRYEEAQKDETQQDGYLEWYEEQISKGLYFLCIDCSGKYGADLELYIHFPEKDNLKLGVNNRFAQLTLTEKTMIMDAYFGVNKKQKVQADAPLKAIKNKKGKVVSKKIPTSKVTHYKKINKGVLWQTVQLVAECPNLEGKQITFQVFEKTLLLNEKDKALTLIYKGEEKTSITTQVKEGFAVAEVKLQHCKIDEDNKDWEKILDPDKGELKTTELYLKVEATGNVYTVVNKGVFLKNDTFKLGATVDLYEIHYNHKIYKTIFKNAKKGAYYYIDSSNKKHLIFITKYNKIKSKYISLFYGGKEVNLIDLRDYKSYNKNGLKFKFDMKINDDRPWIYQDTFASLLGAMLEVGYEDLFCTGFSKKDGSPGVSTSHKNGFNGDFRYLIKDTTKAGQRLRLDYSEEKNNIQGYDNLDKVRQEKLIDAFYNFGWKSFLSQKYGKNFTLKLKRTTHDKKKNHYDHLHLQGYDRKFIKKK